MSGYQSSSEEMFPKVMTISKEKKKQLISLYESGSSVANASKFLGIKSSSAHAIISRYRKGGEEFIKKRWGGNRKTFRTVEVLNEIEKVIENDHKVTLNEIKVILEKKGINLTKSLIHSALTKDLKITRRLHNFKIEKLNSLETVQLRKEYATNFLNNAPKTKDKWIFLDDCTFNLHLPKTAQKSYANEEQYISVQNNKNIILLISMSGSGGIHTNTISERTCKLENFYIFLKEVIELLNEAENMQGSWIIMNNDDKYNTSTIHDIMSSTNYELKYLPINSAMLNPISYMTKQIKNEVRAVLSDDTNLIDNFHAGINKINREDCNRYVDQMLENLKKAENDEMLENI